MAYSLVSPNTFALKLKIHCKVCERKVKNMLLKIQGVHLVKIDEKLGNVIISGTVDPATILTILEKLGRKAELLWEQGTPVNNSAKNVQIITQSKVINPLNDPDIMTQLEQLSGIPGLQTVEVTKTIKLTFQGESRNDSTDKILEISTTNNVNKPHQQLLSHDQYSHGGGPGGFCAASSSCCGGHAAISSGGARIFTPWGGALPLNSQPLPMTAPPWSTTDTTPSAPTLASEYFQAPTSAPSSSSPKPYTYYSVLSDENANGCIIQ